MPTHDDKDPPQSTAELYRAPQRTHEVHYIQRGVGIIVDCLDCRALILHSTNPYGTDRRERDYCGRCQPV